MIQVIAPHCPTCHVIAVHPLTEPVWCDQCCWGDRCDEPKHLDRSKKPPCCNGTGKVFRPPLTDEQIYGRPCECAFPLEIVPAAKEGKVDIVHRGLRYCEICHGTKRVGAAENRWRCLHCGRADIVADNPTWHDTIEGWRERSKTTVLRGTPRDLRSLILPRLFPAAIDSEDRPGTWTIEVRYEPNPRTR